MGQVALHVRLKHPVWPIYLQCKPTPLPRDKFGSSCRGLGSCECGGHSHAGAASALLSSPAGDAAPLAILPFVAFPNGAPQPPSQPALIMVLLCAAIHQPWGFRD